MSFLKKIYEGHKINKKNKESYSREEKLLEMKQYYLTQWNNNLITKDQYKMYIEQLELDYKRDVLQSQQTSLGEATSDLLVNVVSGTVKGIFTMSGVGKNRNK